MSQFERRYGVALVGDGVISIPLLNAAGNDFATNADWVPEVGDVKQNGVNVAHLPTYNAVTGLWDFTLTSVEMQAAQVTVMIDDGTGIFDSFIIETFGAPGAEGETRIVAVFTIKRALGIDQDDTTQDARLVEMENMAAAWLEKETKRRFSVPQSRVDILPGKGGRTLYLPGHMDGPGAPDPEFVYVTVRERLIGGNSEDWETLEDFERQGDKLVRTDGYAWQSNTEYEVTYLDGYHTAPKDIQALVLELVKGDYATEGEDAGVTSEKIGDYSYTVGGVSASAGGSSLSDTGRKTLNNWKRLLV